MPFVPARCTQCGAELSVDSSKDAAICNYCGTPFVVEKAINNYTVNQNINASVVNVYGGGASDFVIRAGTLEKYVGAATEVVIPDSVTIIGAKAFEGCIGLTNVIIPDSVKTIGNQAFYGCEGLSGIAIPDSVTTIKGQAFGLCTSLSSVTIPSSVKSIEGGTFENCRSLTSVLIPHSVISIGFRAFEGCTNLISVSIPNSVTSMDHHAFRDCISLKSVTLSDYLRRTALDAFCETPWYEQVTKWKERGRCEYCGGRLSFFSKCTKCGIKQ